MNNLFFELIQITLGNREDLTSIPTEKEWRGLYQMAVKQSLVGVLFSAIQKSNEGNPAVKPPKALFYKWLGSVNQIEQANKKVSQAANQLFRIFKNGGLRCCVLKGQGLSLLYPEPLRRQSGDIDLWVEGSREKTLLFLNEKYFGIGKIVVHHVDVRIIHGVETEIHFIPSYTYNPFRYRKYKKFFREEAAKQFAHYDQKMGFAYPTNQFNAVYLLLHIFRHVFNEGIGLRQLLDYYYVLLKMTDEERKWAYEKLRWLGLEKFTASIMFVLQKVFLLENKYLLCQPSEKYGQFIMEEIFQGGNFGRYSDRYQKAHSSNSLNLYLMNVKRLFKLINICPSEALWAPMWKPAHWMWRKMKGYA